MPTGEVGGPRASVHVAPGATRTQGILTLVSGSSVDRGVERCGRYTLTARIAVGGMAEVYRATRDDGHVCVIKRMLPEVGAMRGAREMFGEEARIGALVDHPNVVSVLELGESDGAPWLALEHIAGVDLRRFATWLRRGSGRIEPQLAVFIMRQLLAGLIAVHTARDEQGTALEVVHRDVSPSNTLLSTQGRVLLGDFGIAHAMMAGSFPSAHKGARGKLGYVAPEQLRGSHVDQRADGEARQHDEAEGDHGRRVEGAPVAGHGEEVQDDHRHDEHHDDGELSQGGALVRVSVPVFVVAVVVLVALGRILEVDGLFRVGGFLLERRGKEALGPRHRLARRIVRALDVVRALDAVPFFTAAHRRQNPGKRSAKSVKNSRRPSSIARTKNILVTAE